MIWGSGFTLKTAGFGSRIILGETSLFTMGTGLEIPVTAGCGCRVIPGVRLGFSGARRKWMNVLVGRHCLPARSLLMVGGFSMAFVLVLISILAWSRTFSCS